MSIQGEVLRHPINGTTEETWDGFSWPALFFGVIWLLVKGLYGHFLINLVVLVLSAGFAAPIVWIIYGFIGNGAHKSSLLKKGYFTNNQWDARCPIPCDHVPIRSWPLFRARDLMRGVIESFKREQSQ